MISEGSCDTEE